MIAAKIAGFLAGSWGRFFIGAGLVSALVILWQVDRASQKEIGALEERVNTEKQDNVAIEQADRAGALSRDPNARGVRDPYAGPKVGAEGD